MRTQLAADSAHQAQAILGAWASGNIELFHTQLERVGENPVESVESEELERMELLRAIAADLRGPSIQPSANDPENIYGNLLRHLAFAHNSQRNGYFPVQGARLQ
jgi:hypothetical protein